MLIRYEYELLSSIVANGISKINGDIVVLLKRIDNEFKDEKLYEYLQYLELNGIIEYKEDKINILIENWVEFFVKKINEIFYINHMDVLCKKKIEVGKLTKEFFIEFFISGTSKKFKLIFNNCDAEEYFDDNLIFMNIPAISSQEIFWIDLINNINLLNQFFSYLKNEATYINKNAYREINIFEGIDDKYINEIFNVSIKKYFKKKKHTIRNFDKDECYNIEKLLIDDKLLYYGVQFQECTLWVIKKDKKIKFITIKNNDIIYSKEIEKEIDILQDKLIKKISEFNSLILYKENNILDSVLKTIGKISTICVPISLIISLLAFININIVMLINNRIMNILVFVSIIILAALQIYLLVVIILPVFKLSKFSWRIK